MQCKHPPHRLYASNWYNPEDDLWYAWVACCDCGEVLNDKIPLPGQKHGKTNYNRRACKSIKDHT